MVRSYPELLASIDAIDPVAYAKTRNQLNGAVTRLSPYISRGILTLPLVRERLLARHAPDDCEKLIQELAWREYLQRVWWSQGDAIFRDLRFERVDWRHAAFVQGIVAAQTGITAIDAAVEALYETGYMHNQARMWVAALACNLARAHWYPMGKWLYHHLLDGDPASNFCSWQWVAGTAVNTRYTCNQALINACSGQVQHHTFLDRPRDELLTMPIPAALYASEMFELSTAYPVVSPVPSFAQEVVCLYTPWTLDPTYRMGEATRRILVIDPMWFDRLPVSEMVMDFIIRQGQTVIDELEIFIGAVVDLPDLRLAQAVYTRAHPTNQNWPVLRDDPPWLFPDIAGYYPSFSKYWQAVTAQYQLDGTPRQS